MTSEEQVLADVAEVLDGAATAELMQRGHEIVVATRAVFRRARQLAVERAGVTSPPAQVATALTELGEQLCQLVDELREDLGQFAKGARR